MSLPATDIECDERLVKVLVVYVLERDMPLNVVSQILMDQLKDKSTYLAKFNEILSHVRDHT
jgi:hypothetical protein